MATKTLMTIADFDALEEIEGVKQELIDGELVLTPSPMPLHNIVCSNLGIPLGPFIREHKLGRLLWSQDYSIGDDVLNPDLAFIRAERVIEKDRRPGWAPDLVVEFGRPAMSANRRIFAARPSVTSTAARKPCGYSIPRPASPASKSPASRLRSSTSSPAASLKIATCC